MQYPSKISWIQRLSRCYSNVEPRPRKLLTANKKKLMINEFHFSIVIFTWRFFSQHSYNKYQSNIFLHMWDRYINMKKLIIPPGNSYTEEVFNKWVNNMRVGTRLFLKGESHLHQRVILCNNGIYLSFILIVLLYTQIAFLLVIAYF